MQEYIRNQLVEDYQNEQLTLFEDYNPFTEGKNKSFFRIFVGYSV